MQNRQNVASEELEVNDVAVLSEDGVLTLLLRPYRSVGLCLNAAPVPPALIPCCCVKWIDKDEPGEEPPAEILPLSEARSRVQKGE